MKIYLVYRETLEDGHSEVIGFCQTEDEAYKMCDKPLEGGRRYCYWIEELEELT